MTVSEAVFRTRMMDAEDFAAAVARDRTCFWNDADRIEIDEIVDFVLEVFPPEKIPLAVYLFGSFAYGTPDENSDFDICLVTPKPMAYAVSACRGEVFQKRIKKEHNRALDILVAVEEDFLGDCASMFFDSAREKGILLYKNNLLLDFSWLKR